MTSTQVSDFLICLQTLRSWSHLFLLFLFCHHEVHHAACKPRWMSAQFPCDVTAYNTTKVKFDCRGRLLTEVPRGITHNVTDLDLSENFIKAIKGNEFSNMSNLTWLKLSWANKNKNMTIGEDSFKNLTKLKELQLTGIYLKEIPANLPVSLETLELDHNKILLLDRRRLANLKNLTQLFLSQNCYMWDPCGRSVEIEDDTFADLTSLQTLDLSFNNLTQVPKGLPESLKNLSVASNYIQQIHKNDFQNLTNLKELELQGNCPRCQNAPYPCVTCINISLTIHPDAFQNLVNLVTLNLGGNSLKYLKPSWFEKLHKLRELFLSFNFLVNAITQEAAFLRYLPSLVRVDLSFNYALKSYPRTLNLSEEFSNLTSLRTLHLEGLVFQNIEQSTLKSLYGLKNLSALNLGTNFIIHSDSTVFSKFQNLKMIYLAENRLYPVPVTRTPTPRNGYNQRSPLSFKPLTQHSQPTGYEITHAFIKKQCFDSGKVLVLSSNNLFFISPKQFEGYGDIACLNLSGNGFSAALNGTEFSSLPNLTYLDLSYNKIDLAYDNSFKELKKLKVLDLSYNPHYFKAFGLTHNLNFLKNLPDLQVLNMSHNSIHTLTTKQLHSESLTELQFAYNSLGVLWKEKDGSYTKLFTNLHNLTVLEISHNRISKIPDNVYESLPRNLTKLSIHHNLLTDFSWDKLKFFHQLQILDLSFNSLSYIAGINSSITQSLTLLDLSHNHIFHLKDGLFNGPKSLQTLSLSFNKLTLVNSSSFGDENNIRTLFLHKNPLQCICDSLDFILWIESSPIKIPRLTTAVTCDTPENQKGKPLVYFDIRQCVNDDLALKLYIVTTSIIVVFMLLVTAFPLFYWDFSYITHYLKAKLMGYKSLNFPDNAYDVFVTYDTKDSHVSEWVMSNLRVKLEEDGEKHLPMCLEERDWPPGVPLVDNLMQSIRYSRKTLFVLTEGYVKTGIFKMAMYLAHQRLLDENVDVIVLLMLEPVLQHSHFLRLRKRLCGKSVVEWPRTAAAEPWFWQNLKTVIRKDNQGMYNKTYSKYFTNE
uniref:Toll like receptor 8 n=1 Tax=Oryzias latipes TaxID=8090 RepID=H2MU17_ORYLA